MASIELKAPAKVNLFLNVLNKRSDSYHNIHTLFEAISLYDTIRISKIHSGISVSSDKFITRKAKDNLVYRAAELMLKEKKLTGGVKIEITKRIPIGGGLGGGSSDAASILLGINRLFSLKLSKIELRRLACKIGSDVPFFVLEAPFAVGTSRGERLEIVRSGIRLWHLIVYPGFRVSTKEVYEAFDLLPGRLTRPTSGDKIHSSLTGDACFDRLESMLYNDLEDITIAKKNVVGRIIERLTSLDKRAIVSGSGPSVFCLYRTRKEALRAKRRLLTAVPAAEKKGWQVFIAQTMS